MRITNSEALLYSSDLQEAGGRKLSTQMGKHAETKPRLAVYCSVASCLKVANTHTMHKPSTFQILQRNILEHD